MSYEICNIFTVIQFLNPGRETRATSLWSTNSQTKYSYITIMIYIILYILLSPTQDEQNLSELRLSCVDDENQCNVSCKSTILLISYQYWRLRWRVGEAIMKAWLVIPVWFRPGSPFPSTASNISGPSSAPVHTWSCPASWRKSSLNSSLQTRPPAAAEVVSPLT